MRNSRSKKSYNFGIANNTQNIILTILVVAVAVTFIMGALKGKKVSAKNSKDYEAWQTEAILESERISNLNVYEKIKEGRKISLLILGDGYAKNIGEDLQEATWYDKLGSSITEQYNSQVAITNLSQKGNNIYDGFTQYLSMHNKQFDMVVLSFDKYKEQQFTDENYKGIFEALIREVKENNPNGDIIVVAQHEVYKDSKTFDTIKSLSENYGLDIADVNQAFKENEDELISVNTGYPTDIGYNKYFETIKAVIDNNVESIKVINTDSEILYEKSKSFQEQYLNNSVLSMNGFDSKESSVIGSNKDSFVEYEASGAILGVSFMQTPKSGSIEVYINDALYKKIDTKSDVEKISSTIISDALTGKYKVKIVNTEDKPVQILGVISSGKEE